MPGARKETNDASGVLSKARRLQTNRVALSLKSQVTTQVGAAIAQALGYSGMNTDTR